MLANFIERRKEIKGKIEEIANGLVAANDMILIALKECDKTMLSNAKGEIKNVGHRTDEIDNAIVTTLALHAPEATDLRTMVSYLKATNELLRAAANTRSFINGFLEVCEMMNLDAIKEYAVPMQKETLKALKNMAKMVNEECADESQDLYNKVVIAEGKTDDLYDMIENAIFELAKEVEDFSTYHNVLGSLRKIEKIADRSVGIASLLLYANNGGEIHH
jgi:phosphate transport system protein